MELSISFFHERNPELIGISAMAVKNLLTLSIKWNSCIDNNVLPPSILEELEDSKSVFDTIVNNEVVQKLWVCALNEK